MLLVDQELPVLRCTKCKAVIDIPIKHQAIHNRLAFRDRAGNQGNLNPEIYALAASAPLVFHDVTIATSGISSCDVITPSMCNVPPSVMDTLNFWIEV